MKTSLFYVHHSLTSRIYFSYLENIILISIQYAKNKDLFLFILKLISIIDHITLVNYYYTFVFLNFNFLKDRRNQ